MEGINKNTLKKRRQRENVKKDPIKDAANRKKEKERIHKYRQEKKAALEDHPILQKKQREKKMLEVRRYRQKKKEKTAQEEATEGRRSGAARLREISKQTQLLEKNDELKRKKEDVKKQKEVLRVQKYRLRVKLIDPQDSEEMETSASNSPFSSPSTERRTVRKVKQSLPRTPAKRAKVIEKLANSPSCKELLKDACIHNETRKKLKMHEALMETVTKNLSELKPKGGMSIEQRRAYAGLRQLVSAAKLKSTKTRKDIPSGTKKWWELTRRQRRDRIPDSIKKAVTEFYLSPGVSREVPDKKSVVKMKSGELKQRHNMVMTLNEAYELFRKVYPQHKIGLTMFRKFRPIQVKRVLETTRRTCLCQKCCNVALKTDALKKHVAMEKLNVDTVVSKHDIVNMTLCTYTGNFAKKECLERQCDNCSTSSVSTHYQQVKQNMGTIKWNVWEYIQVEKNGQMKRIISCITKETSIAEFFDAYEKDIHSLSSHLFRADWQHEQMKKCTQQLPTMVMDFAENYSCHFQNEVQSGFFDKTQVVIHPMMLYYTDGDISVKHSVIGVAEDQTKDVSLVKAFEDVATAQFETAGYTQHIHQWSDGCAAQYKGKRSFRDISARAKPAITRNYFETSHGKSVCDGLGAITKNALAQAVLSGKAIIPNAQSLFDYCNANLTSKKEWSENGQKFISKREFVLIKPADIPSLKEEVKTVPGTRSFHSVRGMGKTGQIQARALSCYCGGCISGTACTNSSHVTPWEIKEVKLTSDPKRAQPADLVSMEYNTFFVYCLGLLFRLFNLLL